MVFKVLLAPGMRPTRPESGKHFKGKNNSVGILLFAFFLFSPLPGAPHPPPPSPPPLSLSALALIVDFKYLDYYNEKKKS